MLKKIAFTFFVALLMLITLPTVWAAATPASPPVMSGTESIQGGPVMPGTITAITMRGKIRTFGNACG